MDKGYDIVESDGWKRVMGRVGEEEEEKGGWRGFFGDGMG